MKRDYSGRGSSAAGLTLVEILIATAILLTLIAVIVNVFVFSTRENAVLLGTRKVVDSLQTAVEITGKDAHAAEEMFLLDITGGNRSDVCEPASTDTPDEKVADSGARESCLSVIVPSLGEVTYELANQRLRRVGGECSGTPSGSCATILLEGIDTSASKFYYFEEDGVPRISLLIHTLGNPEIYLQTTFTSFKTSETVK